MSVGGPKILQLKFRISEDRTFALLIQFGIEPIGKNQINKIGKHQLVKRNLTFICITVLVTYTVYKNQHLIGYFNEVFLISVFSVFDIYCSFFWLTLVPVCCHSFSFLARDSLQNSNSSWPWIGNRKCQANFKDSENGSLKSNILSWRLLTHIYLTDICLTCFFYSISLFVEWFKFLKKQNKNTTIQSSAPIGNKICRQKCRNVPYRSSLLLKGTRIP